MIDCPHAARCSGCTRLAQPYDAQLVDKTAEATRQVARFDELSPVEIASCDGATPIVGYRTRAKWMVSRGAVGLFARASDHEVLDLPGCRVVPQSFLDVAAALRAMLADGGAASSIVGVDLRDADGARVLVTLVHDRALADAHAMLAPLARRLMEQVPAVAGVARASRDPSSPRLLGGAPSHLVGVSSLRDGGHTATFGGFVQAHRGQAAKVQAAVVAAMRDVGAKTALDVFGGSGAIGLALARAGAEVELVEVVPSAAKVADADARRDGLPLTTKIADADELTKETRKRDLVVVDPPRRGLSPPLRVAVARLATRAIVYVSCDPGTLARDLSHLARLGFRAEKVSPLDMIPLSDEIESVTVLRPAAPTPLRVLHDSDTFVVVDKPPHEPFTHDADGTLSLLSRVRARFPGAVAVGALSPQTSGVAVFAKQASGAALLRAKLGDTRYTALVRGVPRGHGSLRRAGPRVTLSYERTDVIGGHGLVDVVAAPSDKHGVLPALAKIGHPAVGDTRDGHAPTNAFFFATAALDRAFVHCARVTIGDATFDSPLAADLALTLERLRKA